jgi:hypothetical protein
MLATPYDVTNFTPRLSPRAERRKGMRLASQICPGSPDGSAFAIESGSDFAIGITRTGSRAVPEPSRVGHHHTVIIECDLAAG